MKKFWVTLLIGICLFTTSVICSAEEDLAVAIQNYTKAIARNPKDATAYYNRGHAYEDSKLYEQAVNDYNKAIELNPKFVDAYYRLGIVHYYPFRKDSQAIRYFDKVIELNPNHAWAYERRGEAYAGVFFQAI